MSKECYDIVCDKGMTIESIVGQVRLIKNFPCSIHIYDRVFCVDNKEQTWTLAIGLEVGWFLSEEHQEHYARNEIPE